jgi:sugar O-acyltransferase (sialic acid O-acetyltransferase NeuD family)
MLTPSPFTVSVLPGRAQLERSATVVVIYGSGGFAREVLQLIRNLAATGIRIDCLGFLVDPGFGRSTVVHNLMVLDDVDWLRKREEVAVNIAIASPAARRRIAERIERDIGSRFMTLIHPRAAIGDTVSLGSGSTACTGCVATVDIQVGTHVQLHVNCTIGHDAMVENFATIAPGANIGGAAKIGEGAFVGSGAVVLPQIRIGDWSIVGAGSVVTADVPDNSTVVGVPAKVIAQRASHWHLGSDYHGIEQLYAGSHR